MDMQRRKNKDKRKEIKDMETRVEKTIERHNKGYNCAQAVACTYCDLVGMDEEWAAWKEPAVHLPVRVL